MARSTIAAVVKSAATADAQPTYANDHGSRQQSRASGPLPPPPEEAARLAADSVARENSSVCLYEKYSSLNDMPLNDWRGSGSAARGYYTHPVLESGWTARNLLLFFFR